MFWIERVKNFWDIITLHLDGSGRSSISPHNRGMDGITRAIGSPERGDAIVPYWKLRSLVKRSVSPIRVRHVVRPPLPLTAILHPHPFLFNLAIVMLMRSVSFMGGEEKGHIISREEGHVWMLCVRPRAGVRAYAWGVCVHTYAIGSRKNCSDLKEEGFVLRALQFRRKQYILSRTCIAAEIWILSSLSKTCKIRRMPSVAFISVINFYLKFDLRRWPWEKKYKIFRKYVSPLFLPLRNKDFVLKTFKAHGFSNMTSSC